MASGNSDNGKPNANVPEDTVNASLVSGFMLFSKGKPTYDLKIKVAADGTPEITLSQDNSGDRVEILNPNFKSS